MVASLATVIPKNIKLISIDGTAVTVLLQDGSELRFQFSSPERVSEALAVWAKTSEVAKAVLAPTDQLKVEAAPRSLERQPFGETAAFA